MNTFYDFMVHEIHPVECTSLLPCGFLHAESTHKFTPSEDDWGFADFVKLSVLSNARQDFMPDGNLHIRVKLRVKLEEKYTGMTRQLTGYVGLKNQVQTPCDCYATLRLVSFQAPVCGTGTTAA